MQLVISTESNQKFSIGLADESQPIDFEFVDKPFVQSEFALQTIDKIFKKHKISNQQSTISNNSINEIIVISGPGDFSAVRIGISIANALAYAWNITVKAVELEKNYQSEEKKIKDVLKMSEKVKASKIAKPVYIAEPNITMS